MSAWQTASENRNAIERWILERTDAVPDQYTEYSNSNYFLLAEIIEKVTGVPYESFITQRILSPIGMNSTGFADTWDYSRGIITATDGWGDNEWYGYDGVRYGAGDMVSTASDLALWAHEYIPGQNRVLSDSIVQRMTQNYGGGDYGYGLMLDDSYRLPPRQPAALQLGVRRAARPRLCAGAARYALEHPARLAISDPCRRL